MKFLRLTRQKKLYVIHHMFIFSSYNLHTLQKHTNTLQKATMTLSSSPFSSTGCCELTAEIFPKV